jgi:polysaccharide pyruvyl transferase WcaK-like protein
MVFGCGAGPLRSVEGRAAVRAVLSGADAITVRDEGSAEELLGAGIPGDRVRVTADPAFLLRSDRDAGERVQERLRELGFAAARRWLAVAPRDLKDASLDRRWETSLVRAIRAHASSTGSSVLLLPFHRGWDEPVLERVAAGLDGIPHAILAGADDRETAWAVSHSHLAVAMRLHCLVFALAGGVPAVSLAYEPKVEHLATRAGFGRYCFSMNDAGRLEAALRDMEESRPTLERDARTAAKLLRRSAAESFDVARELVSQRGSNVPEPPAALAELLDPLVDRIRLLESEAGGRR